MFNKADVVENYILEQLAKQQEGWIELKRTELADKISCAPSQISYVLSTRFTHDRGYSVESRRGLGGYIRITVIAYPDDERTFLYREMLDRIAKDTPFEAIKTMLQFLIKEKYITRREGEIVARTILSLYNSEDEGQMTSSERAKLTREIFTTLADVT
ncbi:MAG: CtsR family transcriptional regulator [Selenomonadaceae bacterium]|nr:CtsR family transcriptional regulator [Selenomonadaceae bacterium]